MIPEKCCRNTSDSNIKVSDQRSTTAVFENAEKAAHTLVRFDGCVVTGSVACDWIVEKVNVGRIAVELKGTDVDHAAKQVESALRFLRDNGLNDLPVAGLIVCTRYPRIDTTVQRIKQRIAKTYSAPLTVKTDGRALAFESLLSF